MRYIDGDKLNEFIEKRGAELAITVSNCCNFKEIAKMIPTADVVPRSEVEKAKREVATEIFEELSKIFKKHEKSYNTEICELLFEDLGTGIAELKKKYIGE